MKNNIVIVVFLFIMVSLIFCSIEFSESTTSGNPVSNNSLNILTEESFNFSEKPTGKLEPGDIAGVDKENKGLLTSEIVKEELSKLSPNEIADYPLTDLSPDTLLKVFSTLDITNLEKVLKNLNPDTLREILNKKISQDNSKEILNRLSPTKIKEILERL